MQTRTVSAHRPLGPAAIVACLALLATLHASQAPAPPDIIAKVKAQVAPDTRVAVFDVKAEPNAGALEVTGEVDQTASKEAVLNGLRAAGYPELVDRVTVLPEASLAVRPVGLVTVSVANMKSKPSDAAELSNQLVMGAAVRVLKKDRGWYFVQSRDDGYLGWVDAGQLVLQTDTEARSVTSSRRVIVTAAYATIRERAAEAADPVSDAVMGDLVQLKQASGGWYEVRLPDGRAGFLPAESGAEYEGWKSSRRAAGDDIEKTARLFLGVPYLWGGTSSKGFDCSGFSKTVFRASGVELQRDADQQSNQGVAVAPDADFAALRKGDLLFFGPRPGVTRITHVAIYLGDKRFIHCSGMVKINSFDPASPIYSENLLQRLVKVRRMIPAPGAGVEAGRADHSGARESSGPAGSWRRAGGPAPG